MRMPLDLMVWYWKGKEEGDESIVEEYVQTLKARMETVRDLAYGKEINEKCKQKKHHDKSAKDRSFVVGDYVLVFRPVKKDKLMNQWDGPYPITKVVTSVTYQVDLGTKLKRYWTYHVNCIKKWTSPVASVFMSLMEDKKEEALGKKHTLTLATHQTIELCQLKEKFKDVLQDTPGRTGLVQHAIPTKDALPVRLPPYRLAHTTIDTLNEEVKTLLEQEIIRPSNSPWAAPIVLVAKKDETRRMCIDYRRLNKITVKDPYPLPNIKELISTLGASTFITTLDLSKGY